MREPKRLQFDLTPEALRLLDALKVASGAATRAELVRNALKVYTTLLRWQQEGYQLRLAKGPEVRDIEFLPSLGPIAPQSRRKK